MSNCDYENTMTDRKGYPMVTPNDQQIEEAWDGIFILQAVSILSWLLIHPVDTTKSKIA